MNKLLNTPRRTHEFVIGFFTGYFACAIVYIITAII